MEPTIQPSAAAQHPGQQDCPLTDRRNSHPLQSPPPFAAEYRIASPSREPVGELTSERADSPADIRVHPPNTKADFSPSLLEPMATQSVQSSGTSVPNTSLLISSMANTLGYGLHHTASTSMPHPLSPSFNPWSATAPMQLPTTLPLPFQTPGSPFTLLPDTPHSHPHIQPTSIQLSDSQPPHTFQPLSSPFNSSPPQTFQPLSYPMQIPPSGTPVSTVAISAIPTPTAALHHPLSSSHVPSQSANGVPIPSDFHQLSCATPLIHAVQDTTTGSPTTPISPHNHSLHVNVNETSFELGTLAHPYPLAHTHQLKQDEPVHYPKPANALQPPTPYGVNTDTTSQRLETNADVLVPVQTQPLSEKLSIVTLETSHTHSEQPAGAPSPSPSPSFHSSSSEKEQEPEQHCSSKSQTDTSDSDDSSYEEERQSVDNVNLGASLGEGEGPTPELERGINRSAIQLHHPLLLPTMNDNELEETESSEGEVERDFKAHSETKQHYRRSPDPDSDSSEDSDSSSNPNQHGRFMPLPEHSPKSIQPVSRDDTQPHSPSLEDGTSSSDNSPFGGPQGHSASPLSLQEAFLRRKEQFILKSKHRLEQLKENAQKRQAAQNSPVMAHSTPRLVLQPYKPLSTSNVHHQGGWGRGLVTGSHGDQSSTCKERDADARRRAVTFSSPLAIPQDTEKFTPPKFLGIILCTCTLLPHTHVQGVKLLVLSVCHHHENCQIATSRHLSDSYNHLSTMKLSK